MPGLGRKATIQLKKPVFEEEEAKEKIKFDIFNNNEDEGGETTDYKKKTVLDNDDNKDKPIMLKANKIAKKYEFFDEDD
jgi:hypothetical protein